MHQLRPAALLCVAVAAALAAGAARADIEECGGSNAEITACVWEHYEAADAELNAVWRDVLEEINRSSDAIPAAALQEWRAGLIKAQRAWAEFKDSDCRVAVAHEWYGGSGAAAAIGSCLYAHTTDRVEDLRERYLDR